MAKFTYASLFSGIGGFEQALNKFGGHCVFASEIDKFAAKAYEVLYGHKPTGDITQIEAKDVPDHDLLVGGFPCQAFSVAGKRKGFEDTRGTLFFEIARIAKEKQPKALLLENVKGLVNHDKGRTLDIMIETLNEIGYVVDFDVLNSKYFGVPQNRERIFIVAIRDDLVEQEDWTEETTKGQTVVPRGKRRLMRYKWLKAFNFDWSAQEEVTTRLRDILETVVDEKYYLDEEKTARLVAQLEETLPAHFPTPGDVNNTIRAGGKGSLTAKHNYDHIAEPQILGHVDIRGNDSIKRTYSTEGISPTLTTMGGGHREPKIAEEQGLPIREATKKGYAIAEEGDSVNVQFPNSKTRRGRVGKQIANTLEASSINQGVVVPKQESEPKIDIIGTTLDTGAKGTNSRHWVHEADNGIVGTVDATTYKQPKQIYGRSTQYRIRKLTPLECWRLQGFPDEAHEAVKQAGISDSQRYKQAGNAVTVNVIEAIAERLIPLITK